MRYFGGDESGAISGESGIVRMRQTDTTFDLGYD